MASFTSKRAARDARKSKSYVFSGKPDFGPQADVSLTPVLDKNINAPGLYSNLPASLEIGKDQAKGRGIRSKQAFKLGTTLLMNRPHISVLSTPNLSSYCSSCTSPSKNENPLKRCTKCRTIWYCSSACQNEDWSFHKFECPAIISWMTSAPEGSPPSEAIRSLGRILWGRKIKGEESSWWKEIEALQSHRFSLPPSAIESHTQLAHALVRYLGVTSPAELEPYGLHFSGDLVDLISRFTTNAFSLTTSSLSPLGTCVSPVAALFNHSCLPNAVIVFPHSSHLTGRSRAPSEEPALNVVAIKDISAGEEILTAYIDTSVPKSQRQQSLKETYNFTCTCPLCTSMSGIDPREALWCPRACGGTCCIPQPEGQDTTLSPPRCVKCKTSFSQSTFQDIKDKIRIGQAALNKATSIQFSDPAQALKVTSHILPLLSAHLPPSSHPVLALLRLHQSLLITSLAPSMDLVVLNDAIRAAARAVSGLISVFVEGHPVRGVGLVELGKLLAVDEPPSTESTTSNAISSFPPSGAARLALAIETLQRALKELIVGFGKSTGGGDIGREVREEIVKLEREIGIWNRGVTNVGEYLTPFTDST